MTDFATFSALPELMSVPAVWRFAGQLDQRLSEARTLMHLPIDGENSLLHEPLYNALCEALLSIAAGLSTCLMDVTEESVRGEAGGAKARFLKFFTRFYPWRQVDYPAVEGASLMWEHFRNPLVHNLGFLKGRAPGPIQILKHSRSREQIVDLHVSAMHLREPTMLNDPSLSRDGSYIALRTHMLYWGVVYAARRLANEEALLLQAERVYQQL